MAESNVPQLVDKKGGSYSAIAPRLEVGKFNDKIKPVINYTIAKDTWTDLVHAHEGPSDTKENRIMNLKRKNMWDINMLTLEQYMALTRRNNGQGIVKPEIGNNIDFEIRSQFIKELRLNLFAGTEDEDADEHVRRVLEIADLFHIPRVTHDAIMIRVFPITLTGAARRWKTMLPVGLINTWDLLEKAFIQKYCPPLKNAKKLEEIRNFKQEMDETLYRD
ncbi:ribonuclease H-like domain-containing protein [Tanacetum coccineum]